MENEILDLRGLKCPLPALFAQRALARAKPGQTIAMLADDPLAVIDITHMCAVGGHTLIAITREDGHARFVVRRAES